MKSTRRNFVKKLSIGTIGTLTLGASACTSELKKHNKAVDKVVWPSDKLNIAVVGITHRGNSNIRAVKDLDVNIVALCEVDWGINARKVFDEFPNAKRYMDFRKMFEKQKDIDAVIIATPDHTHGVIASMAIKMGKHVYCEKPLAHSIYEVREIGRAHV